MPAGEPYILSQYLAKNKIEISGLLSGKAAWLGSEYPWPFVETDFQIRVDSELKYPKIAAYAILGLAAFLLWASIHGTYLAVQLFNKFSSF